MAGKQRSVAPPSPVQSKCYQFDVPKSTGTESRFYLPVNLPSFPPLPADVALWLIELRHKSESSDLALPRLSVVGEGGWESEEDECLSQPESGVHDHETEQVCLNLQDNEDAVLNLDLYRKKNSNNNRTDYDNDDLYQIWEGLKIPRQSLCSTSLRVPNLNTSSEVLSRNSETDSRSNVENPSAHSFWELNPMYSKGSLTDSGDLSPKKRQDDVEWNGKKQRGFTSGKSDADEVESYGRSGYKVNDSAEEILCRAAKGDYNQNWRLTDITEESVDEVGTVLNHENNYGLDDREDCINVQTDANQPSKRNSALEMKCVNILNNLDDMIQTFEKIQEKVFSNENNNTHSDICIKDNEFDHMCERAEHIIEETLKCHTDSRKSPTKVSVLKKPQLETILKQVKLERTSSDMSDEVFLNPVTEKDNSFSPVFSTEDSQRQQRLNSSDVNHIFDDGSKTTPPVPPIRKKKTQERFNTAVPEIVETKPNSGKESVMLKVQCLNGNAILQLNDVRKVETKDEQTHVKTKDKVLEPVMSTGHSKIKHEGNNETIAEKNKNISAENKILKIDKPNIEKDGSKHRIELTVPIKDTVPSSSKSISTDNIKPGVSNVTQPPVPARPTITEKLGPKPVKAPNETLPDKCFSSLDSTDNIKVTLPPVPARPTITEKLGPKPVKAPNETLPDKCFSSLDSTDSIKVTLPPVPARPTITEKLGPKPVKAPNETLPDECFSSLDSNDNLLFDPKIQLTQTRPISFTTFPPSNPLSDKPPTTLPRTNASLFKDQIVNQQKPSPLTKPEIFARSNTNSSFTGRPISFHTFSKTLPNTSSSGILPDSSPNTTLLKYSITGEDYNDSQTTSRTSSPSDTPKSSRGTTSDISRPKSHRSSFDATSLDESLERTRKGSSASDIAAWKLRLQLTSSYYHDEEMDPNSMMSNEWFSSNNSILSEENAKDGSWGMVPDINVTPCTMSTVGVSNTQPKKDQSRSPEEDPRTEKLSVANIASLIEAELRGTHHGPYRVKKAKSLLLVYPKVSADEKGELATNWAEQWDTNMRVLKEGVLCRTKITEHGKKVRKNWVTSYAVLTETYMMFFKDVKTFNTMKISADKFHPELSVELSGAIVEHDEKLSSRKHVMVLSDTQGLQVLLQLSSTSATEQWFHLINTTIALLTSTDGQLRLPSRECNLTCAETNSHDENLLKSPKMGRTRSIKLTNRDLESNEDLSTSAEERQTKNKARLKKFFGRRPTKESLVKKGIYKDEPMFGRNLCDVVSDCTPCVPRFVTKCIDVIESKDENMKTDGLYRASGNLSQVQKIRLQVDQNQLCALELEEDVHVLTGALKLFFRELKKPLIPYELFNKAIMASAIRDHKERVLQFRQLVRALPTPNHNTLDCLLQHLLKVNQNKEFNRMHIPNIAIVFGPTLMWPEEESLNMALDLMKQNLVIECLLVEYYDIFR